MRKGHPYMYIFPFARALNIVGFITSRALQTSCARLRRVPAHRVRARHKGNNTA